MPSINKRLLRLAAAIHAKLLNRRTSEPLIEMPTGNWQRCGDLARQLRRAQLRGWNLAADVLRGDLSYACSSVVQELDVLSRSLSRPVTSVRVANIGHIYDDLQALEQEFGDLDDDRKFLRLSIVTDPITLEGVYLGPFEIRLQWASSSPTYRVIAKDPHPSESRDNVTHPHVMDEVLCEGDGHHAIKQALSQGRLLDFFTLVTGILKTYNPDSPFVELALWRGCSCSDCGTLVEEDYCYSCDKCHADICGECEARCCDCDESHCSDCIGSCAACEDNYCRRCLQSCQGCHRFVCSGCLTEERCTNCHEEESEEGVGSDREGETSTSAAVQPHGVGQATVPA